MNKIQLFYEILLNQSITPVFQPIVSLQDGSTLGYEALSRITIDPCEITTEELFDIAGGEQQLWKLEKICRSLALTAAANKPHHAKLFVNVAANIIHDPKLKSGFTIKKLSETSINPDDIIIEVTEKSEISQYEDASIIETIRHYRSQHFNIAIDDYGSGYSGLNRVCIFNPDFLKLDMNLIRNIDKDSFKRSAVESTIKFCKENAILVIAEGIETKAELNTLIQLGADYGQGYYLARPNKNFVTPCDEVIRTIKTFYATYNQAGSNSHLGSIHNIGHRKETFLPTEDSLPIYNQMVNDMSITEFFVINENANILGILTRSHLLECYSGQYGYNLSKRCSIGHLMEIDFLSVDAQTPIEEVATLAMNRPQNQIYNAIAITKNDRYISTVSVKDLLLTAIQIQVKYATDASPLTGLPGNSRIQECLHKIISQSKAWSVAYIDLDNFKAYNDAYGFGKGDIMIELLAETITTCCISNEFCGHVGGDDFVIISNHYELPALCEQICQQFRLRIHHLYSPSDWKRGYIESQNRAGIPEKFSLASLSIAIVSNEEGSMDFANLSSQIAMLKKESKKLPGNSIVSSTKKVAVS